MAIVRWSESEPERTAGTLEELEAILSDLQSVAARDKPLLVCVERSPGKDSLSIGLGRAVSVLNFVAGSGDPPYYTSRGDSDDDDGTMHFYFMDSWSEFPNKCAISLEDALSAMRHFWRTGERDPAVRWEES